MWNRCDVCGQFIALSSFECCEATRRLITPDSHFTKEEYETLCIKHSKGAKDGQSTPQSDLNKET